MTTKDEVFANVIRSYLLATKDFASKFSPQDARPSVYLGYGEYQKKQEEMFLKACEVRETKMIPRNS